MIRASRLDRRITIERERTTLDEYRQPRTTWTEVATVWAELLTLATDEFLRPFGEEEKAVVGFRIRHLRDLTARDRVVYQGQPFNIRRLQEVRDGLDLQCEAVS